VDVVKGAKAPNTFKGALTGTTYENLDAMIAQERRAALTTVLAPTEAEIAFDNLPIEEVQARIKHEVHQEMVKANTLSTQKNGQAWATLNPWYSDTTENAKWVLTQLRANGVPDGLATIEQFDNAVNQLLPTGVLTFNKKEVAKQAAAEVAQLAETHKELAFDEEEAEGLSMDELRRRADIAAKKVSNKGKL